MATVAIYKSGQSVMKGKPHIMFDVSNFVSGSAQPNPEGGFCLVLVIKGRKDVFLCYKDRNTLQKYANRLASGITQAKAGTDVSVPFF